MSESHGRHTLRKLGRDLDGLRAQALRMAELAQSILAKSLRAVRELDAELAAEVKQDDLEIDQLDVDIDDSVLHILALDAPVAVDLRQVVAIKSISTDLERVGDIARNISGCARRLASRPRVDLPEQLEMLAERSQAALKKAVAALAELDGEAAREVLAEDDSIDELEDTMIREAIARLSDSPDFAKQEVDLIFIAQSLERVGDHATNIAEEVVLAAEARNLKHSNKLGRA